MPSLARKPARAYFSHTRCHSPIPLLHSHTSRPHSSGLWHPLRSETHLEKETRPSPPLLSIGASVLRATRRASADTKTLSLPTWTPHSASNTVSSTLYPPSAFSTSPSPPRSFHSWRTLLEPTRRAHPPTPRTTRAFPTSRRRIRIHSRAGATL